MICCMTYNYLYALYIIAAIFAFLCIQGIRHISKVLRDYIYVLPKYMMECYHLKNEYLEGFIERKRG